MLLPKFLSRKISPEKSLDFSLQKNRSKIDPKKKAQICREIA